MLWIKPYDFISEEGYQMRSRPAAFSTTRGAIWLRRALKHGANTTLNAPRWMLSTLGCDAATPSCRPGARVLSASCAWRMAKLTTLYTFSQTCGSTAKSSKRKPLKSFSWFVETPSRHLYQPLCRLQQLDKQNETMSVFFFYFYVDKFFANRFVIATTLRIFVFWGQSYLRNSLAYFSKVWIHIHCTQV